MKCLFFVALAVAMAMGDILSDIRQLSPSDAGKHAWVVLAAGSNGWSNYRHQADVCHVYQSVHAMGIPDEHIIVMMYDDLAQSSSNPTKGILINEPNGPDVYHGVPKDYTGSQASTSNFVKIITGDSSAPGKVLNTTTEDNVFIYFDDHGGPGIIAFPVGEYYTSAMLGKNIETMNTKKMFKKLTFYIQACYSGSMWYAQTLPPNVYGVSSAPIQASAYAFEYDNKRGTYLASRWAYAFAHLAEVAPGQTLQEEFDGTWEWVKNWSLPCQYGDLMIPKQETLRSFLDADHGKRSINAISELAEGETVPDYLVPYEIARHKYLSSKSDAALSALRKEQDVRMKIDSKIYSIMQKVAPKAPHFQTVPCDVCDNTCECMQECDESATVCKFECCDEKACTQKNPTDGIECGMKLGQAWAMSCATKDKHDYNAIAYRHFFRLCRHQGLDVDAALKAINDECSA